MPGSALVQQQTNPFPHGQMIQSPLGLNPYAEEYAPAPIVKPPNAFGSLRVKTYAPPSLAQKSISETRNLLIVDTNPNASKQMWRSRLERFGEVRHFDYEKSEISTVSTILVCYYNINDCTSCYEEIGKVAQVTVDYAIPDENLKMGNQGTLVVFNVDDRATVDDLTDLFKTFGSVKDIRSSSKKGHRFVEFYDVRTAEKAHASSSKEPLELFGRNLNVEYSRPKPQSITPHGGAAMTPFTPGPASEYMYTENAMLLHPMSPPPFSNAIPGPAVYVSPVPAQYVHQHMNRRPEGSYRSSRSSPRSAGGEKSDSSESSKNKKNCFTFSEEEASSKSARTTLMIKNIPNKYSQKMMLELLNKDFSATFDFFYLPIDFKNNCNLGYAFVNFQKAEDSLRFYRQYHMKKWIQFNSKKVCEVTYARVQGKPALVEHFKNARYPVHIAGDCQPFM